MNSEPIYNNQRSLSALSPLLASAPQGSAQSTVSQSHFFEPLDENASSIRGHSRRWGDVSTKAQQDVVGLLLTEADAAQFSVREKAFLLSLVRAESGFNPDAASKLSSATGLGQFIDSTGQAYGLTSTTRFDILAQVKAIVQHTKENLNQSYKQLLAKDSDQSFIHAYALHHDGPSLRYGGKELATKLVLPFVQKFVGWLEQGSVSRPL